MSDLAALPSGVGGAATSTARRGASRLRDEPVATVALVLAVGLTLALIGGPVALVGAGLGLAALAVAASDVLHRAWVLRRTVGVAILLLLVPLLLALLSFEPVGGHPSLRLLRDDVTGIALGTLLVACAVLVFAGARTIAVVRRSADAAPWRTFVADRGPSGPPPQALAQVAAGALLLLVALALALAPRSPVGPFGDQPGTVLAFVLVALAGLLVAPALAAIALVGRGDRQARELAVQRQAVAAHLHDSVLQTFALVQRRIDDPEEVRRLIRLQERELRDWLAGRDAPRADALAGSLREMVDEVEAQLGVAIELDLVGDRPVDDGVVELVAAAREALRNAARHAAGAAIRVVGDVADDPTVVYVRDEGPGFVLDDVPRQRRGIRDAIMARMESVGGEARIETAPGAGTEVELRLPYRAGDRPGSGS